jgi:hypothetical protein
LDLLSGPGGAILGVDYSGGEIRVSLPDDPAAAGKMVAYDIFPWRAPARGAFPFVIGGAGFADLAGTQVLFGTRPAELTSVSPTRIKGWIPAEEKPGAAFLPVTVRSGGRSAVIADAFRYLLEPGQGTGVWREEAVWASTGAVGAVAEVDGLVYTIGDAGEGVFQAFNPAFGRWEGGLPAPPVPVRGPRLVALPGAVAGRGAPEGPGAAGAELLLLGQPLSGGAWVPQVYNPQAGRWRIWEAGPASGRVPAAAESGGKIYVCGAGPGETAVAAVYVFDLKTGLWSVTPALPLPCSDAAVAAVGDRIAVLGGVGARRGLVLQVFAPGTGTWSNPLEWGDVEAPNRFGATAVYFNQELYLFGGRTIDGQTMARVDAIRWNSLTVRPEAALPVPAWGVGVVAWENSFSVLGGRASAQPLYRHWSLAR